MPGLTSTPGQQLKRKRPYRGETHERAPKSSKAPKVTKDGQGAQAQIVRLEEEILQSRQHYNNVVKLQELVGNARKKPKTAVFAAVSLCRVFCRLIAGEELVIRSKDINEADEQVAKWLKERLRDYVQNLSGWIGSPDATMENTALTLLMRVVRAEVSQIPKRADQAWRTNTSTFYLIIKGLLENTGAEGARQEFVDKYAEEFDDVRFFTMLAVKQFFSAQSNVTEENVSNALDLLEQMKGIPESEEQLEDWYGQPPQSKSHQLMSWNAHRKAAQDCWLSIFRSTLTTAHRKTILGIISEQILPWFSNRVELLTDFLTDSFNEGGSTSLLALNGIFHLITQRNIDYPDFYAKLYSLLDDDVLHSKQRSRFFRLFDQFMASTHLPAAMVASFIKRLASLSLQAPPGAIVWIVPWVYNMMRKHPTCTFMLHRPYHPAHAIYSSHPQYAEEGVNDPYESTQTDPMLTNAIESSLWELHTLQDHWHPNVATLAKIVGEQFTKREYQLEDFLDHNYATLIDAELGKDMKKQPEVEWEILKRILTAEDTALNELGGLLWSAIDV